MGVEKELHDSKPRRRSSGRGFLKSSLIMIEPFESPGYVAGKMCLRLMHVDDHSLNIDLVYIWVNKAEVILWPNTSNHRPPVDAGRVATSFFDRPPTGVPIKAIAEHSLYT